MAKAVFTVIVLVLAHMIIYETYYGVDALHMPKAGKRNVFTNQPFSDYIRLLKTRKNQNGEPFEIPLLESGEEWPVSSNRDLESEFQNTN